MIYNWSTAKMQKKKTKKKKQKKKQEAHGPFRRKSVSSINLDFEGPLSTLLT
jgi:hypothetical protein